VPASERDRQTVGPTREPALDEERGIDRRDRRRVDRGQVGAELGRAPWR